MPSLIVTVTMPSTAEIAEWAQYRPMLGRSTDKSSVERADGG